MVFLYNPARRIGQMVGNDEAFGNDSEFLPNDSEVAPNDDLEDFERDLENDLAKALMEESGWPSLPTFGKHTMVVVHVVEYDRLRPEVLTALRGNDLATVELESIHDVLDALKRLVNKPMMLFGRTNAAGRAFPTYEPATPGKAHIHANNFLLYALRASASDPNVRILGFGYTLGSTMFDLCGQEVVAPAVLLTTFQKEQVFTTIPIDQDELVTRPFAIDLAVPLASDSPEAMTENERAKAFLRTVMPENVRGILRGDDVPCPEPDTPSFSDFFVAL